MLTDGLLAYYPFNGSALDASGHGNDGTVSHAALVNDRFGASNSAYEFNGVDSFISIPHKPSLNLIQDFTVSVWFNQRISGNFRLMDKATSTTDDGWTFDIESAKPMQFQRRQRRTFSMGPWTISGFTSVHWMESEISYLYRLESGGLPHLTMSVRSVELTILGVPGRRYQLESSLNAKSWTNVGQPFVATEAEISEEFDVLETGRYFKIVEAPVQP